MDIRKKFKDVGIVDKDGKIEYLSITSPEFFDFKPEDLIGKKFTQTYSNIDEESSTFMRAIRKKERFINYEQVLVTERGKIVKQTEDIYTIHSGKEVIGAIEFADYDEKIDLISARQEADIILERNVEDLTMDDIVGSCEKISDIKRKVKLIADSESPILIMGETGTGKELIAHVIHNFSKRKNKEFVYVNCSAIPENLLEGILFGIREGSFTDAVEKEGLFKQADRGTLFLDEVDSMPLGIQSKLLRAIEEKAVRPIGAAEEEYIDVRIIASCNLNTAELIHSDKIRNDLFFRLSVIQFELPPLRERSEDILRIVEYYIDYYNRLFKKDIRDYSEDFRQEVMSYPWPGNVREIRNMLEGIFPFLNSQTITLADIDERFPGSKEVAKADDTAMEDYQQFAESGLGLSEYIKRYEEERITDALDKSEGDIKKAAKELGVSVQLMKYKTKKI